MLWFLPWQRSITRFKQQEGQVYRFRPKTGGRYLWHWLVEETHRKVTIHSTLFLYPSQLACCFFNRIFCIAFFSSFFYHGLYNPPSNLLLSKALWKRQSLGQRAQKKAIPSFVLLTPKPCFWRQSVPHIPPEILGSPRFLAPLPANQKQLPCDPSPPSCVPLTWHSRCSHVYFSSRYWSFFNRGFSKIAIWPRNINPNGEVK